MRVLQPEACLQGLSCHPSSCLESSHSALARKPGQSIMLMQLCSFWCPSCGVQSCTEYLENTWKWLFNCFFLRLLGFCWKSPLPQSRISYFKLAMCQSDSKGSVRCRDLYSERDRLCSAKRGCGSGAVIAALPKTPLSWAAFSVRARYFHTPEVLVFKLILSSSWHYLFIVLHYLL